MNESATCPKSGLRTRSVAATPAVSAGAGADVGADAVAGAGASLLKQSPIVTRG
jgi:hypothetical protein